MNNNFNKNPFEFQKTIINGYMKIDVMKKWYYYLTILIIYIKESFDNNIEPDRGNRYRL